MMPEFLLIALGTLASEDLACVAAGVLVAKGQMSFAVATAACMAGIFGGDMLLFLAGRIVGWRALRWQLVARYLPPGKVEKGLAWINRRGLSVVLLSRFTPGLRLPTYFAAGLLGASTARFVGFFLLAAALWTPLLVGMSWLLGEGFIRSALDRTNSFLPMLAGAAAVMIGLRYAFYNRMKIRLRLKRAAQWEFWPAWVAYLPLVPYFLYLAAKHRSLTLFTAANPGIATGGFVGESKSASLRNLRAAESFVAEHEFLPAALDVQAKVDQVLSFTTEFPVVLKPDVGERGSGVAIVRTVQEIEEYFRAATADVIVQRYVPGIEFGVFYCRRPDEPTGRIVSITEKRFPVVTGDGTRSLVELIMTDPRAACIAGIYERLCRRPMDSVPDRGERVQLVEIGSHCRGAIFLDATHLSTAALEETVERVSRTHPEFYFGRFDVRTPSLEAFQRGVFQVIELNGVGAEATHIYDPAVSIVSAYQTLFRQWRVAFEIGSLNRQRGARPETLRSLLRIIAGHRPAGGRTPKSALLSAESGPMPGS